MFVICFIVYDIIKPNYLRNICVLKKFILQTKSNYLSKVVLIDANKNNLIKNAIKNIRSGARFLGYFFFARLVQIYESDHAVLGENCVFILFEHKSFKRSEK